jgi:hypothetical protein
MAWYAEAATASGLDAATNHLWKILEPLFNFSQYLSLWSHVSLALPPLPPLPLQIKL